jgi:ATP-dependent DNA helicase RecG
LPDDWTLEKLLGKHPSLPFNPLVANAFFRAGYIEAWGRGIEKIQRECREHDIPAPDFDHGMSGLMLTFHANPRRLKGVLGEGVRLDEKLDERLDEKLGENRAAIVRIMRKNPRITVSEVAQALQISRTAADKNIQVLKAKGYIKRVGPAKGGHWEVLK